MRGIIEPSGETDTSLNKEAEEGLVKLPIPRGNIDILPIAVLTMFLALGVCGGVFARTNELLGPRPENLVRRWRGTGLSDQELERRLFDQLYPKAKLDEKSSTIKAVESNSPPLNVEQASSPVLSQLTAGVFAVSAQSCELTALKHGSELKTRLLSIAPEVMQKPLLKCNEESCLVFAKELMCGPGR
jgi:hypothetical protein